MFSYSDLVDHSCTKCFHGTIAIAPEDMLGSIGEREVDLEGDCLWFLLAEVCFEWAATITQTQPTWIYLKQKGKFTIHYDDVGKQAAPDPRDFECLRKDSETSEIVTTLHATAPVILLPGETSSSSTFDTIRTWMSECLSDHSGCRGGGAQQRALSGIRFLRIDNGHVTLIEGVEPERYACLSYCWGDGKNLIQTTIQNRNAHIKSGVKVEVLPKTYQDALVVCKELGINYIWIDSLCIMQGDDEDWREQASLMAHIYENSYVTIAAVAAQNASQGFFSTTSRPRMVSPLPKIPWMNVREALRLPDAKDEGYRSKTDDGWALYKRGWTFQELSLSPRVLHFGSQEVVWSCLEKVVSEGDLEKKARQPTHVFVHPSTAWYQIVSGYSWRNLTFGKDRLPAIAAFASRYQAQHVKSRYIAGLWQDTLLIDLLWFCVRGDNHLEPDYPIEPGRIPSWSWASSMRPVHWLWAIPKYCQHIPCTEVIQVTYNTRGPPILGDIVDASLILQAPIIKLCKSDLKTQGGVYDYVAAVGYGYVTMGGCKWDNLQLRSHDRDAPLEAFAVPLVAPRFGVQQPGTGQNALLVMEECPGVYRRAGVGTLHVSPSMADTKTVRGTFVQQTWTDEERRDERIKWFIEVMGGYERRIIKLV